VGSDKKGGMKLLHREKACDQRKDARAYESEKYKGKGGQIPKKRT